MKLNDPHLHLNSITWNGLAEMAVAGVSKIISAIHLDTAKAVSPETIIATWDSLLEVHFGRAKANLIQPYAMLGASMVCAPSGDAQVLWEALPGYLARPEVVAVGEIGLEPSSACCPDMAVQEELVRRQVDIARQSGTKANLHTPNPPDQKKLYTQRTLDICREVGIDMGQVVIEHCSEANLALVLDAGAWAGITVQPVRQLTPEMAADLVAQFGSERVMIDSDHSGLPADHLSVPKTAYAMRKKDIPLETVLKVCADNSNGLYGI